MLSFFKSPWFAIVAGALGTALTQAASDFPQYGAYITIASAVLHYLTTQAAKNSPSPKQAEEIKMASMRNPPVAP